MPRKSKAYDMIPASVDLQLQLLGERLREARLRRNWKQGYVAEITGMSTHTLSRIEHGDSHAPIGMIAQLMCAYNMTMEWQQLALEQNDRIGRSMEKPNRRFRARTNQGKTTMPFEV